MVDKYHTCDFYFELMITQTELAEKIGVARETLSRAFSGSPSVSEKLRERIFAEGKKYNYRPNSAALAMRNGRHRHVGILTNNPPNRPRNNLAAFEVILGVNQELEKEQFVASMLHSHDRDGEDLLLKRAFKENLLDGVIVIGNTSDSITRQVSDSFSNVISVECNHWFENDCLRRDEKHSGHLLAKTLVEAGYDEFSWIGPIPTSSESEHFSLRERYESVRDSLSSYGIDLHPEKEERFFETRNAQAVIAYDMMYAQRFQHSVLPKLMEQKGKLTIASCDERHETHLHWPSLIRISNARFDLGRKAARMFLKRLQGDTPIKSVKVRGKLIPGELQFS